jgi:lysophospholipid acyltransferase (LPLAT)-like uncharacterized protein
MGAAGRRWRPSIQRHVTDWRTSRVKRFQAAAIAAVGYPLLTALGGTWSWRVEGAEHYDAVLASGRQPILALWHGRILAATLYFKHRGIVALTSENFDGEWIARIHERFGYRAARGSTSRSGRKAMLQLTREIGAGRPVAFTVDGPRGPARVAQPGAVWLARATGNPVLPFHAEASSHWSASSWDHTQVPKPFSTIAFVIGEPMRVAPPADEQGLEAARAELERRLLELEARALALLGRK